jgi:hypothetical protein
MSATRLLEAFEQVFRNGPYKHRNQGHGNFIANHIFDDLMILGRSTSLLSGVRNERYVVNRANLVRGRMGRRGDGTLGELIPGESSREENGFIVRRGPIARVAMGVETKILAKAMRKQIDRVITDLNNQADVFRRQSSDAIAVALVGVNHSDVYTSYEGDREYAAATPPKREATEAVRRLNEHVADSFDELVILPFRATNVSPYPFEWVSPAAIKQDYGAALIRISHLFDRRFTTSGLQ